MRIHIVACAVAPLFAIGCTRPSPGHLGPDGGTGAVGADLAAVAPTDLSTSATDQSAPADLAALADLLAPPDLGDGVDPHKVDVLFLVDNSTSMQAMQSELHARFAQFLAPFQKLADNGKFVDLHVGVVTSDYGAGTVATVGSGCSASPGGQKGILQAIGAAAPMGCLAPTGAPFIKYQFAPSGATPSSNLPAGQDVFQTFTCMASVGSMGCGFEHQLEAVYAALRNSSENAGFIRNDAQLAVVFLTNEDDGSAPPMTDIFNGDPAKVATYGAFDTYRQTRYGVACGSPLALTPEAASMGPLVGCVAAPNNAVEMLGAEYDVSRYITLFTAPASAGGIKSNPANVFLVAIDAPDDRVETILASSGTGAGVPPNPQYVPCTMIDPVNRTCVVRLQHSCQNQADPAFFGDPAVRLNAVVRASQNSQISSICGADPMQAPNYTDALTNLSQVLAARIH